MKKITLLFLLSSIVSYSQYTYFGTDLAPAIESAYPNDITPFNGKIYFGATFKKTSSNGGNYYDQELGYYDPSDDSYGELANINPIEDVVSAGSLPRDFFEFNGYLYFVASSGLSLANRELYRTDGVTTTLFKDLVVGEGSGFPQGTKPHFTIMNNKLYFFASSDASNGYPVLWQTDGSPENTIVVSTVIHSSLSSKNCLVAFKNELYYSGADTFGTEVYKYNDTNKTVTLLKDLYPGVNSGSPTEFTIFNNELFFISFTPSYTGKRKICKTDGTTAGTRDVLDAANYSHTPNSITVLNDKLVFVAVNPNTNVVDLFKCEYNNSISDYEISLVKHFTKGPNNNSLYLTDEFTLLNNELYFVASENTDYNNGYVRQIYKTNGTTLGTVKAITIDNNQVGAAQGVVPFKLFVFNGKLCFGMYDGQTQGQLWISNGSNTYLEKLTNIGNGLPLQPDFVNYKVVDNNLYFSAASINPYKGTELWRIQDSSTLSNSKFDTIDTVLIYPNPTKNSFNIQGENLDEFTVEIYDLLGKKVSEFHNQKTIDISSLNMGTYIVKIKDSQNKVTAQKIIKQ